MKNILVICAALTAVTCGAVCAQDTTTTAKPYTIAKTESIKVLKGVVVSVDTVAAVVIVKSWQAVDTIIVNANTGITAGIKETIGLADLKTNDGVTVYYKSKESGKTALKIIKRVPPPPVPADTAGSK